MRHAISLTETRLDVPVHSSTTDVTRIRMQFESDTIVPEVGQTYTVRITEVVREVVER